MRYRTTLCCRPGAVAPQALGYKKAHLLSVSSKGELAVLIDAQFVNHRLFGGTLARMPVDGAPRPWLEHVREADWSPDGSTVAAIHEMGLQDRLEFPPGTTLYTAPAGSYLSDPRVSPDGREVAFFEHPTRFDDRGWMKVVDRNGKVRTLTPEHKGEEGLAWLRGGESIVYSAQAPEYEGYQPLRVAASGATPPELFLPTLGTAFVLDVAPDGRMLIARTDDRLSVRASAWDGARAGILVAQRRAGPVSLRRRTVAAVHRPESDGWPELCGSPPTDRQRRGRPARRRKRCGAVPRWPMGTWGGVQLGAGDCVPRWARRTAAPAARTARAREPRLLVS